jgi:hypothetical protein
LLIATGYGAGVEEVLVGSGRTSDTHGGSRLCAKEIRIRWTPGTRNMNSTANHSKTSPLNDKHAVSRSIKQWEGRD